MWRYIERNMQSPVVVFRTTIITHPMVHTLDGSSEHDANVPRKISHLVTQKLLFTYRQKSVYFYLTSYMRNVF